MDINEYMDNSRRYRWLQRASRKQILLWMGAFGRSNNSIDTYIRLELLEEELVNSLRIRDSFLEEIATLKESLRLTQKDGEENCN